MADSNKQATERAKRANKTVTKTANETATAARNISLDILVFINLLIVAGAVILKFINPFVVNYTEAIKKSDIINFTSFVPVILVILSTIVYRSLKPIKALAEVDKLGPRQLQEIRTAAFNLPTKITVQFLVVIFSIVAFVALVVDAIFFRFYPFLDRLVSMGLIWAYAICSSLVVFVYTRQKMVPILRATSGVAEDKGLRLPIKGRFIIATLTLSAMVFLFTFVYSFSRMNDAFWHDEVEAGKALLVSFKIRADEIGSKRELKEYIDSMPSGGNFFIVNSNGDFITPKPPIIPDGFDIRNRVLADTEGTARVIGVPMTALRILPLDGKFKGLYAGSVITMDPLKQSKMRFMSLFFVAIGCFLLVFVVIISYYVANDTSTAVRNVARRMAKISDRKETLYEEVEVTSLDEIGDLIRAFNNLQRVVNSYHHELDNANRKLVEMERRRADDAVHDYRLLAENVTDVIFTLDQDMRITYVSPSVQRLRGYSAEESMTQSIQDWFPPGSLWAAQNAFQKGMKMANKDQNNRFMSRTLELEVICKEGPTVWTEARTNPLFSSEGRPMGTLCVLRDITERKKMEEEMMKVEKLEAVGVLAGGIAHDFNNLLTAVIGNLSFAEFQVSPEDDVFESLIQAKNASRQASQLTQQLLTFSKGGAPIKETASISELIEDTASFVLRGSKIKYESFLSNNLWPVKVDKGQISQVINNLIINASQAMPEGGVIRISGKNVNVEANNNSSLKKGKYIKISIIDQGTGIPQKYLDKIFDPYFTTKKTGSGLGLATSYSIIKNHGGHIDVESEVGVGTAFHIYLPVSEKEIFVVQRVCTAKEIALYGHEKILFMDDQQTIRDMVEKILIRLGYEVQSAREGDEAVRLYQDAKEAGRAFDAVILDLTIPGGMGGKEVVQKLHEIDPHVKAIVSSGYSNDPIMSEYKQYGFRGVVTKPYTIKELSETLRKVIMEAEESLQT